MSRHRHRAGRDIHGVVLLDKPVGITSNAALQRVKRLLQARKAGHTGSLDPLASGLLPICLGEATKISAYLLDANKRYWVRVKLGVRTTTGDAEGEVISSCPVHGITRADVERILERFLGKIEQIPPMYSALKWNGKRLYDLARAGTEVERKPRTVSIYSLALEHFEEQQIEFDVRCSKGTYIRTLAEDIGTALGVGAHVAGLRRTEVGPYALEAAVRMEQVEAATTPATNCTESLLLPVESALSDWPEVHLSDDAAYYVRMGQAVLVPRAPTSGWVRLYSTKSRFLGVGQILDDGKVTPRRLINVG